MDQKDILFLIAVFGFFGIKGADLLNAGSNFVNQLYINLGGLFWPIVIGIVYLILNKNQ